MSIRIKNRNGKREVVQANFSNMGGLSRGTSAAGTAQTTSYLLGAELKSGLLEGIIDEKTPEQLHAVYRDIYMHDPISGGAVDLRASLPWSDFTLSGADDKQIAVFEENIERLNMRSLHSELSTDQMVTGAFVSSLVYDPKVKGFTDLIPYNYASCEIQPVPLYSVDPIIRLNVPKEIKDFANDKSPEALRLHKKIPPSILQHFRTSKQVDLDPVSTIYVPRTTLTTLQVGVSYFRRVLPIYLLERILFRGTISEATRRQRATLHIMAGDEEWIPSEEDLNSLVGLFQATEQDPISSVVATRSGILTQEIRQGGDFWKWTDVSEQLADMKMRALGINEAFLSGEASYSTLETALSVFLEELRAYREKTTKQVYTDKLFPLIASLNGFVRKDTDKKETAYLQDINYQLNDTRHLVIPEVNWHKQLRPEADMNYMEVLDKMAEKGVPVPLRAWAAAGGMNMDSLVQGLDEDLELRTSIKKIQDKFKGGGEEDDSTEEMYATLRRVSSSVPSIVARDYGEASELYERTVTGKKKHIIFQTRANRKLNETIAKSLSNLSDPNVFRTALRRNSNG